MAGIIGGTPLGGMLSRPYFSTMQPFAYRDTLNMLTWLRAVTCNLDTLRERVNDIGDAVGKIPEDTETALQKIVDDTTAALAALDTTLRALIAESSSTGTVLSPVHGQVQSVQHVFEDMYDNVRVFALFAVDYDTMGLSAEEYDSLGARAREYDLHATDVRNAILGDFTGVADFLPINK